MAVVTGGGGLEVEDSGTEPIIPFEQVMISQRTLPHRVIVRINVVVGKPHMPLRALWGKSGLVSLRSALKGRA